MKKFKKVFYVLVPVFLVLTLGAGYFLFLSDGGAKMIYANTGGFGPFDLKTSYTPDNLMTIISHYNGDREADYSAYFLLDYIFLGCSFFFMLSVPLLINTFSSKHYLLFRSSVFSAVFTGIFNLVENILLMKIVSGFPGFTDGDANFSSGCTTLKWIFVAIWLFSTFFFAIFTAITAAKKRKKKAKS